MSKICDHQAKLAFALMDGWGVEDVIASGRLTEDQARAAMRRIRSTDSAGFLVRIARRRADAERIARMKARRWK